MELGARMGIGPGGFEPPYPDPKSGVLPLDEGPAVNWRLNLATPLESRQAPTFPLLSRRLAVGQLLGIRSFLRSDTVEISRPFKVGSKAGDPLGPISILPVARY